MVEDFIPSYIVKLCFSLTVKVSTTRHTNKNHTTKQSLIFFKFKIYKTIIAVLLIYDTLLSKNVNT
jgi:heme/copper-type cytochrome/quinol oxidase subunit 4